MNIPVLVEGSLRRYREVLTTPVAGSRSTAFLRAQAGLRELVDAALEGRPLGVDTDATGGISGSVGEAVKAVASTPRQEKRNLLNPLTLGLGAPEPEWVFLGYEAAYGLEEEPNFTLEGCLLSALWRSEASHVAFRQHPYDLYKHTPALANRIRTPGHYWAKISELVEAPDRRWGTRAYLVEICAEPARTHAAAPPGNERVTFLKDLMRSSGARVLVIARRREHRELKEEIAAAFLRNDVLPTSETVSIPNGERSVDTDFIGQHGRLVVFTRHLSNDISHEFLRSLRQAIADRG